MGSIKCKNVERVFLLEAYANEDFAYVIGAQSGEDCEETSLQGRVILPGGNVKWIDGVMLGWVKKPLDFFWGG